MFQGQKLHLQAWREARYLSQQELARLSGVSRQTVYRLETQDPLPNVQYATIRKLAKALGIEPAALRRLPKKGE